jgi:hypothetical protein
MEVNGHYHSSAAFPRKKLRYQLNRRLFEPHSPPERRTEEMKSLAPSEIRTPDCPSRCLDYAIPAAAVKIM